MNHLARRSFWLARRYRAAAVVARLTCATLGMMALVCSQAGLARADTTPGTCSDPRVSWEGAISVRWTEPLRALCDDLRAMPDSDASARLHFVAADDDLMVEAVLADGRTAVRRVRSAEALHLTVEALITVPPTPSGTVAQPQAPAVPPEKPDEAATTSADATPVPAPTSLKIELGVTFGTRVARVPTYLFLSGSAYAGLHVERWLFGLNVRWDALELLPQPGVPGFELEGVGAGFFVARRVYDGKMLSLDAGATALIIGEAEALTTAGREDTETTTDVRFGAMTRALIGPAAWRFTIGLDAELSPARVNRVIILDPALPRLPTWSVGLSLGVSWGER